MTLKKIIIQNIFKFIFVLFCTHFFIEDRNILKSLIFSFVIIFILFIFDIKDYYKNK